VILLSVFMKPESYNNQRPCLCHLLYTVLVTNTECKLGYCSFISLPKELSIALLLQSSTGVLMQTAVFWTWCHSVSHC